MYKKNLIKEIDFTDETGNVFALKYFLVYSNHIVKDDLNFENYNVFSIDVEKYYKNLNEKAVETESTGWISAKQEDVMNIIDLLVKNTVTPVALPYVVDDAADCLFAAY